MAPKISSYEEFESCYLRHRYLERVKIHPTKEEMAPYVSLAVKAAKDTYYTYQSVFNWVGFDLEDVVSISHTYLYVYLGLFSFERQAQEKRDKFINSFRELHGQDPGAAEIVNKNRSTLVLFLRQRMEDLIRVCHQKIRNINGAIVNHSQYFYGVNPPPKDTDLLLKDNREFDYRRMTYAQFRTVKKRAKIRNDRSFWFEGNYYVAVKTTKKFLREEDLHESEADPRLGQHRDTPEDRFFSLEDDSLWQGRAKEFDSYTPELKATLIKFFVDSSENDVTLVEEVKCAKKMLKELNEQLQPQTTR